MHCKIGSPVTGTNYYSRPDVEQDLAGALSSGHTALLAPRRTGKTSMLMHVRDQAEPDVSVFYLNLEAYVTAQEWVQAMLTEVTQAGWFSSMLSPLKRIESFKLLGNEVKIKAEHWKTAANTLIRAINGADRRVIFLLDEFPILIKNMAERGENVGELLHWFRVCRQTQTQQVTFLVTGSIGLGEVVRRLGLLETINDFNTIDFLPFTDAQALDFINTLAGDNNLLLPLPIQQRMLALVGCAWPYFLQIFVNEIQRWQRREGKRVDLSSVEVIYRQRLLSGQRNHYLSHMLDRLSKIFEPEAQQLARTLLKTCAQHPEGLPGNADRGCTESLHYVLRVLQHDGYLRFCVDNRRYYFFSNMLRDYWRVWGC